MAGRPSVVRCCRRRHRHSQCSKIFFSETALPVKANFYVEPPWVGGNDILFAASGSYDQDGRHAIYGKNIQKSSFPEPPGRFSRNLVCSTGDSSPS